MSLLRPNDLDSYMRQLAASGPVAQVMEGQGTGFMPTAPEVAACGPSVRVAQTQFRPPMP
jgi:hypothetical protein